MAIRKTGSRRIVVDEIAYRWRVRRRATNAQADYGSGFLTISVERADEPDAVLVVRSEHPHPADVIRPPANEQVAVTPKAVAKWIRQALQRGWTPAESGPHSCCG